MWGPEPRNTAYTLATVVLLLYESTLSFLEKITIISPNYLKASNSSWVLALFLKRWFHVVHELFCTAESQRGVQLVWREATFRMFS